MALGILPRSARRVIDALETSFSRTAAEIHAGMTEPRAYALVGTVSVVALPI